jgi:Na+-driven multidrug efflux pump
MAIQAAAINISKIVLTSWINTEGVIYSALSGIYNKSGMMIGIVSNSFTTAGSSIVGQNIGARKYDRVSRTVAAVGISGAAFAIVISAVVLMFPDAVCEMFTNDTTVLAEASLIIIPIVLNAWGAATRSPAFAIINGSGNSKLNLTVALLDGIICRIGLALLLGVTFKMGIFGFWYGHAFAGTVPFFIGSVYLYSGAWKSRASTPAPAEA